MRLPCCSGSDRAVFVLSMLPLLPYLASLAISFIHLLYLFLKLAIPCCATYNSGQCLWSYQPLQFIQLVLQGVEWFPATNGSPVLKDSIAYMECKVLSRMETPDHWITYAEVTNGDVINPDERTAVHRRKVGNYY